MEDNEQMMRKIELMHNLFGITNDKCKNCKHYKSYKYHDKTYRKCEVYWITNSEASDWKASYQSCGLFPDKNSGYGRNIMEIRIDDKVETQIEGQYNLFDSV